ncbi:MAG: hypothetical protein LH605_07760, partial [Microbacteriaceae bacterium]|nr:hypothetical protein [Microbacteriaceae bacterium]
SSLRTIGLFITFASVALIVVAFPFARVFEPGGFDNVTAMALVIVAFSLGLVPFSAVFVMQRVFYSLEDTRTPFLVETIKASLFVIGALTCALLPVEFIGVGVALVTTLAGLVQTLITFALLRRRLGPIGGRFLVRRHVQYLFAGAISGAIGVGILISLGGLAPAGFAQRDLFSAIVAISVIGSGMAVVYLGVLLLMRNPDAGSALGTFARRLPRRNRTPRAPE